LNRDGSGRDALRLTTRWLPRALVAALAFALAGCGSEEGDGPPPFVASVPGPEAVVWAVGDGNASDGNRVVKLIEEEGVDRLLYLGDVYEKGTRREFETNYDPTYGRLADEIAPTLGDHESGNAKEGYDPYWREKKGVPTPDYYRFEAGGWEVLGLNSEVPHGPETAQIDWLKSEVAAPGTCRLAFWHRPRFNAGTIHSGDDDVAGFWRILEDRAVIVVNGNEHNMQRFEDEDGITQFIAGTGGNGLYPLRRDPPPELAFGADDDYGAIRFVLTPGNATYEFVSVTGKFLDSGEIPCEEL
jgi:hypothetical protein